MYDALVLGEALIDFTPNGNGNNDNPTFEQNPGGAPANFAVGLSRMGLSTAFIGKVGFDNFGKFLKSVLDDNKVNTSALILDKEHQTTLAFVHIDETGDREFSFYRRQSADVTLCEGDIDFSMIDKARLLHFGTVNMTTEDSYNAHLSAARYALSVGKVVSFDPNLRPSLWNSLSDAKDAMYAGLRLSHIVKISEEELEFLTDEKDLQKGAQTLLKEENIKILLVTRGKHGCDVFAKGNSKHLETYDVKVVDTTGSGDGFFAGFLYCVLSSGKAIEEISFECVVGFADFANASGALAATRKGGIPSLPTALEVRTLIESFEK